MASVGWATIILAGLTGQVTRDRSAPLAVLMYLPLLPVGASAMILDLTRSGRALGRRRFALCFVGAVASTVAAIPMIGWGPMGTAGDNDQDLTLLHWNVQWGGGIFRNEKTWAAQRLEIRRRHADLVILSEVPPVSSLEQLVSDLGPGATWVGIEHDAQSLNLLNLAVCSRWPIRLENRIPLSGGTAMSVIAEFPGRRMRLLVVDGQSNPFRSRLPFLRAIAEACQSAADTGQSYDAVVGDFNTPSRSIGFDALAAQGYRLASRSARGWRGTFPSWLPLYDIDHVWLRGRSISSLALCSTDRPLTTAASLFIFGDGCTCPGRVQRC